jgi:hypothetical protein
MPGVASYHCLKFSTEQGAINKLRRERLLIAANDFIEGEEWAPVSKTELELMWRPLTGSARLKRGNVKK